MKKYKKQRLSETTYLLSTAANRKRLLESIAQINTRALIHVPNVPPVPFVPNSPPVPPKKIKTGQMGQTGKAGQAERDGTAGQLKMKRK